MPGKRIVIVVGAGPAGLAVAATLRTQGVNPILLDRADAVGANWRARYDGLRLNTARWLSGLPGLRIPRRLGRWVGRDDFVDYLECYAGHHQLNLHAGVTVERIARAAGAPTGWRVITDQGTLTASGVVVATGPFDVPVLPHWNGWSRFRGFHCHAASYRRPEPFAGQSVLVIGAGATGLEIATELADGGAGSVHLSIRSCQNLFPRELHGVPLTPLPAAQRLPTAVLDAAGAMIHRAIGRDWPAPLPPAPAALGTALRRDRREPIVADGVVDALRAGTIRLTGAVTGLGESTVELADGSALRPDAVIAATGYTSGLKRLVGELGVLSPDGLPVSPGGGPIVKAPGLAFVGFEPAVTGRLLQIRRQARRAAQVVA